MQTHLLNNGHLRCGNPAGHLSTGMFGSWPRDLRVTANPNATTCPDCRKNADLPPIEVPLELEVLVENVKIIGSNKTAFEDAATALEGSITLQELMDLSMKAAAAMGASFT